MAWFHWHKLDCKTFYWGWFLVLQWLISFQESMTELSAARHLSMRFNFENKQHIGWKIYLKNNTALKVSVAPWEGGFIIGYCIYMYQTFSVLGTVHAISSLSTFFSLLAFFNFFFSFSMRYVLVNTSYSWRLFSFGYIPPLPTTPLFPNYYSTADSGPLARSILTKMLGMLPSVSNWGCLLLLLCLLVLLPLHVIWSIRTDFCIFNVLFMKKKLLGLRRAQKCMLPWGSTVLASLTRLTPSQLNYVD